MKNMKKAQRRSNGSEMVRIDKGMATLLKHIQQTNNLHSMREASSYYMDTSAYSPFVADLIAPIRKRVKSR